MNPSPPPPLPSNLPAIDATCDRIVAALTRRLAQATAQIESVAPSADHDFLVPVMHPELAENITAIADSA
ncbi:hypothetical protein N9K67_02130 [Opitutaceae bacterium]|jgi:hypothetical protein|nr:hypothetical protein [Opitutaceae bacterium]